MEQEARGLEKILRAGPPHAQVSVRMLLPILCAVLAVELTALGFLGRNAERSYGHQELKHLPWETRVALNSAALHRSVPGIATAAVSVLLIALLCRKGVFDATGRWLCLAAAIGMAVYPVAFVTAILLPLQMRSSGLSR